MSRKVKPPRQPTTDGVLLAIGQSRSGMIPSELLELVGGDGQIRLKSLEDGGRRVRLTVLMRTGHNLFEIRDTLRGKYDRVSEWEMTTGGWEICASN